MIAIDLGGTIEDSWQSKSRWFAERGFDLGHWPRSRHQIVQLTGGDAALYEKMAAEIYSESNIRRRELVEGAASALRELSNAFGIIIVSSRVEAQRATTLQWLKRHRLDRYIGHTVLLGSDANKLRWCVRAGVLILIDDDLRHLQPGTLVSELARIHYSGRPAPAAWRRDGIVVAGSWREIVSVINEREFAHAPAVQ